MKLNRYLQSCFGLSREKFDQLPKDAQDALRQMHATYNKESNKNLSDMSFYKFDKPVSIDHILELCKRPVPTLTKEENQKLESDYENLLDKLTSDYIDNVIDEIENASSDSLGLGAKVFIPHPGVPYWYDENTKYLDLDDDDDLKEFVAQELDNKLEHCDANDIGAMRPDATTFWPLYLETDKYGDIDSEYLFMTDGYGENLSDNYNEYIDDKLFSSKYIDIPLKIYFYQNLDGMSRRELGSFDNFKAKVTEWLENHHGKTLFDDDAPFDLDEFALDLTSDNDSYLNYEADLCDVINEKIADLWNNRYYSRAQKLFEQQDKIVDEQVNNVSDNLKQKYQAEIDKTNNPKLATSLLALTLLNHIAKTFSDCNTDMSDPLIKRLASKYNVQSIYNLKNNFLHYIWKHKDKYPELEATVYVPDDPNKYYVTFCEYHNEDRRMSMLSPMEYYYGMKSQIDACPSCEVTKVKNYYAFYYFDFNLGENNTFSYHLPYPIGHKWLPKLSEFKHVDQDFDEGGPFLFGAEANNDEILYALSHDLVKDVKSVMK